LPSSPADISILWFSDFQNGILFLVSCLSKVKEERENETVQIRKEMQNFDFVQNRKVIKNDLEKNESLMKKSFCKKNERRIKQKLSKTVILIFLKLNNLNDD